MSKKDDAQRIGSALKNTLDSHGYSFQYAVVRHCHDLVAQKVSRWRFEVAEFPVDMNGTNTRIDFVLHGTSEYTDFGAYLVCECKRPNPAISTWAFVRAPYTHARAAGRRFNMFDGLRVEQSSQRLFSGPYRFQDGVDPYDIAIELRGDPQGDPQGGPGRGAVEEAATQVLQGVAGLVEFFKHQTKLLKDRALVIPVIFTTARLYGSALDLGAASLKTGKLPAGAATVELPWLWFRYTVSSAFRPKIPQDLEASALMSLGSVLEYQHARSIAIVGPDGIAPFLQALPASLEDFQQLLTR